MNLIRKLKISNLTNLPLEGIDKKIVDFVNSKLNDLIPFKWVEFPDSVFYMNSLGLCVLHIDNKNNFLYIRWSGFWEILVNTFELEYGYIQVLLKYMVEKSFKQKNDISIFIQQHNYKWVEQDFTQKIVLTSIVFKGTADVEIAFQNKIK